MKRILPAVMASLLFLGGWSQAASAYEALCSGPDMPPWATFMHEDYPVLEHPERHALILDGFTVTPCLVHARTFPLGEAHSVPPEMLQWREDYQNAIYQVLFTYGFASLDEIRVRPHEMPFLPNDDTAGVFGAELLTFEGGGVILLFWYTLMPPKHITLYIGVYPYD